MRGIKWALIAMCLSLWLLEDTTSASLAPGWIRHIVGALSGAALAWAVLADWKKDGGNEDE